MQTSALPVQTAMPHYQSLNTAKVWTQTHTHTQADLKRKLTGDRGRGEGGERERKYL